MCGGFLTLQNDKCFVFSTSVNLTFSFVTYVLIFLFRFKHLIIAKTQVSVHLQLVF